MWEKQKKREGFALVREAGVVCEKQTMAHKKTLLLWGKGKGWGCNFWNNTNLSQKHNIAYLFRRDKYLLS